METFVLTSSLHAWCLLWALIAASPGWSTADIPCYTDHGTLNKARGKSVLHSSLAAGSGGLVMDGLRVDRPGECLQTVSEENPWVLVDLAEVTSISTVVITALTALSQLRVQVPGETFDADNVSPTSSLHRRCNIEAVSMKVGEVLYVHCETSLHGRYLLVSTHTTTALKLCEVEVYEEQVFQPEKWTCIVPSLTRPESTLNLARGKPAYQNSNYRSHYAPLAVSGDDFARVETSPYPCAVTAGGPSWWVVDLGLSYTVTGVALTQRTEGCGVGCWRLSGFTIYVGNDAGPSTPFTVSKYQPCVWMCKVQALRRRYYKCMQTVTGRHVAVYGAAITYLELCQVEVYSDNLNDVSFPSFGPFPNLTLPGQEVLYDDDDTTCLLMALQYPTTHSLPVLLLLPWDPDAKTGQRDETSNYFCKQRFYVNVTLSSDLQAFVSQRNEDGVVSSLPVVGMVRECPLIGHSADTSGFVRSKFTCTCVTTCTVSIQVRQRTFGESGGKRICTINLYD